MEWVFVIVLVLGVPIGVGFWLISRAVQSQRRIEELSNRLGELEVEVFRLKREKTSAPAIQPIRETEMAAVQPMQAEALEKLREASPPEPPKIPPVPEVVSPPLAPPIIPLIAKPLPLPIFSQQPVISTPEPIPEPSSVPDAIGTTEPTFEPESGPPPIFSKVTETEPSGEPPREAVSPVAEKSSFEMRLGTYWLVRVGAVMVLTALAFFGNLAYEKFGPGGKIALLYFASALLLGFGTWWQRKAVKDSLRNYAQVLFAGGLAAVYFTTYAAHHIAPLRIIQSPTLDGALLLAWAGFMAWIADRRKSEVLAIFAVGLAYYTSAITHVGAFTLYSNLLLTAVAVGFLVRNRWAGLSFASLVATYAGYAFWRFFQDGDWHWASPEEGLWFGACFLMSYWLAFTAATFLSKAVKLSGETRSLFLTLNNGAFFALFLLTMLQVRHGGFWKFSLIYGIVLLALAGLAKRILPGEPLAKNSYITQGLLLVTLGFISKFAGLKLALVLGVESVTLYVLGTQRKSLVLQVGSYLAAVLAVGWGVDGLERFDARGVWLGSALGALMIVNGVWARRQKSEAESNAPRPAPAYFAVLALAIWCFTTWQNTAHSQFGLALTVEALLLALSIYLLRLPELSLLGQGYLLVAQMAWQFSVPDDIARWTALTLAVNGLVALRLGWQRENIEFKCVAGLSAALAVAWGIQGLERFDSAGLLTGVALAALMIFNAFLTRRRSRDANPDALRPAPTYFSVLTLVLVMATTWFNTSQNNYPVALAAEAVVLTASIYLLRVRELALLGQILLLAGHCVWQFNLFDHGTPPWWNPVAMIGLTLALGHWWQKQKVIVTQTRAPLVFQLVLSLLLVFLACTWLGHACSSKTWLALSCLLAVAGTAYAVATRAWWLAASAQLFLLPGAWLFLCQLSEGGGPYFAALAPIAALGLLSMAAVRWFEQKPDADPRVRNPLLGLALAYRWVALAMSIWWVNEYVPGRERVWVLMGLGFLEFLLVGWKRNREVLLFSAAFTTAGLVLMWLRPHGEPLVYLPNLIVILVLLAQQQIARRVPERFNLEQPIHTAVIVAGCASLWWFMSRWVMKASGGFYLTASWSGLALALFAIGIVLRERIYRWVGLGILAAALGRVVLLDVWKQETIYRVLTFMALGVVLLVLGFIYNKYQETIRKWL